MFDKRHAAWMLACVLGSNADDRLAATAAVPDTPSLNLPQSRREVLPASVTPVHYEWQLTPNAENLTFTGKVDITVNVLTAGLGVTLNAAGLTIDRALADGTLTAGVSLDDKLGRATLSFPSRLAMGAHVLHIEYHGSIGRKTLGFFAMD